MVIAAITLLPALLGFAGHAHRQPDGAAPVAASAEPTRPDAGPRRRPVERAGWRAGPRHVAGTAVALVIGSLAMLLALAAPSLSMRLGMTDDGTMPTGTTERQALRPPRRGLRPRLQRPARCSSVDPAAGERHRPPLDAVAAAVGEADPGVHGRAGAGEPGRRRRRDRRDPDGRRRRIDRDRRSSSTACATTSCPARSPAPTPRSTSAASPPRSSTSPTGSQRPAAAVHRRRHRAVVPAADGRVPLDPRPAQGRGHEPALDRRRLRRDRRGVPVGLVQGPRSGSTQTVPIVASCR